MRAVVYSRPGGPEVLETREVPTPIPGKGQVRVRVHSAVLGLFDQQWFAKPGQERPGLPLRLMAKAVGAIGSPLGNGVAGVVDLVGPGVTEFRPGDRVFGPTIGFRGAGTAEFAVLNVSRAAAIPADVPFQIAAALTDSFETALGAVRAAGVRADMNVLVYGSSGGVGLFTAQLANDAGATVTGVCSTRNQQVAREAGCDHVVDYRTQDAVSPATYPGTRFDRIILVNGDNPVPAYRALLAPGGVIVGVGAAKQAMAVAIRAPFSQRFRAYSSVFKPQQDYLDRAATLAAAGRVRPHVDHVHPASQTAAAVSYLLTQHPQGKVVIDVDFPG